jgi:hypothetical protein
LRRQIHIDLELLSSHFNIIINAQISTVQSSSGIFYNLFGVVGEEIWEMVKTTIPYQSFGFKTLELVVESQKNFNTNYYDLYPISIFKSNNSVLTEKITHSQTPKHPPIHVPIHDENDEEESGTWILRRMTFKM